LLTVPEKKGGKSGPAFACDTGMEVRGSRDRLVRGCMEVQRSGAFGPALAKKGKNSTPGERRHKSPPFPGRKVKGNEGAPMLASGPGGTKRTNERNQKESQ